MSRLLTTTRLEAFSDGVIAVIITIMVLELHVPDAAGIEGLRHLWPILLVYLLSFVFTGVYWVNHDHLIARVERVQPRVLYANLSFLFSLSLLPFFTSYINKHFDSLGAVLYVLQMAATGLTFYWLRVEVLHRLRVSGETEHADEAARRKHIYSLGIYVAMLPLAWFYPTVAMTGLGLVMLIWVLPEMGTDHIQHHTAGQRALRPEAANAREITPPEERGSR